MKRTGQGSRSNFAENACLETAYLHSAYGYNLFSTAFNITVTYYTCIGEEH